MPVIKARLAILPLIPNPQFRFAARGRWRLPADNAGAVILQGDLDEALLSEPLDHFRLDVLRRHEHHKAAAARAQSLPP